MLVTPTLRDDYTVRGMYYWIIGNHTRMLF